MSTQIETMEYILQYLHPRSAFTTRRMFGEYALYANGRVVGFVCDDTLYVKITPQSSPMLDAICEQGQPYPGAKQYYIIDESQIQNLTNLSGILIDIAEHLPVKN